MRSRIIGSIITSTALAAGALSIGASGSGVAQPAHAGGANQNSCAVAWDLCSEGVAITGNNNLRGESVFSFPLFEGDLAPTFGQFIGVHNPDGDLPNVIDAYTPDDAVLASIAPPGFPLYSEPTPLELPIPGQNRRLQETPSIIGPNGAVSGKDGPPLPAMEDAGVLEPAFGSKKKNYALGQWLEASGELKMRCPGDDLTEVKIEVGNLVPNGGVYSMWAFWDNGSRPGPLTVIPFGGSGTNTFSTDKDGAAEIEVTIPFCALNQFELDDGTEGVQLVAVQLDFHSDDGAFGALPNLPLVPYRGPGIIGHSHLIFPVRATPCEELGNCLTRP